MPPIDPRETITEESFAIAAELLGRPLARPARRLAAIAIDLALVFLLVQLGSVVFALAAAWVFFRIAGRPSEGGILRRSWRIAFRTIGALVLFLAVLSAWRAVTQRSAPDRGAAVRESPGAPGLPDAPALTGMEGIAALGELMSLRRAASEEEAQGLADRVAERLREQGLSDEEIREMLREFAVDENQPWAARVADRAVGRLPSEAPATRLADGSLDSLELLYAAAVRAGDSARIVELRPEVGQMLAGERIARLEGRVARLERTNVQLGRELAEAREGIGIMRFLRRAADDLGLGLGWTGLYFTAFTALWRGQTPGKRLLRLRVLRLDGKPMGWWMSFERFGGYAAGFATGLLGFLQVLWDRNRQGIHDKITETVVVRE